MKHLYLIFFLLVPLFFNQENNAQSTSFAGFNDPRVKKVLPSIVSKGEIVKRATTDLADANLKGPVREVLEEDQDLAGTWSQKGKKSSRLLAFDKNGNVTKEIFYDYRGNPNTVTAYGFIDSFRVSKSADIDYDDNPPLQVLSVPNSSSGTMAPPNKEPDSRYSVKYEYKYDEKRRLYEIVTYNNKEEKGRRTVFEYGEQKRTGRWIEVNGDISSSTIEYFDKNGLLIKQVFEHLKANYPDTVYNYTYLAFDKNGNWTKRTIDGQEWGPGYKSAKRQNYIEFRSFRYY